MRTFKDKNGKDWVIEINVATVKRIKGLAGVDILDPKAKAIEQILASENLMLFVDILFATVKPQADSAGISDVQFGESLGGDSLEDASNAWLEELASFFPRNRRELLKTTITKHRELEARALTAVGNHLTSGAIDKEVDAEIQKLFGN